MKFLNSIHFILNTFVLNSNYWKFKVVTVVFVIALLLQTPRYNYLYDYLKGSTSISKLDAVLKQKENTFIHHEYEVGAHEGSMEFRLFVPLFMIITHFNILLTYLMQILFGLYLYYAVLSYFFKKTENKFFSSLVLFSFSMIYAGSSCFIDIYGFYDSFAYFFLLLVFISNKQMLVFLFTLFSLYVDERAYLASIGIIVFEYFSAKDLKKIKIIVLAIIFGIFIRVSLIKWCGMHFSPNQIVPLKVFLLNLNNIGIATITTFKGFWLFALLGSYVLIKTDRYKYFLILLLYSSLFYFSSYAVFDMTRSMSYLIIGIFICLNICLDYYGTEKMIRYMMVVAFFCIICPTYLIQEEVYYIYPFPLLLLKYVVGRMIV